MPVRTEAEIKEWQAARLAESRAEDARQKALWDAMSEEEKNARFVAFASDWQSMAADGRACE